MIPLRVLHVIQPLHAERWHAGSTALLAWQRAAGHAVAVVAVGEGDAPLGLQLLGRRTGAWAWWRRERRAATGRCTDWIADLIHAHGLGCLPAALDLGKRLAMPVVADVDTCADILTTRILRDPRIACTIVPSDAHRAHFLGRIRLERDRVAAVPPGLDLVMAPMPRSADGSLVIGGWFWSGDRHGPDRFCATISALRQAGLAVTGVVATADEGRLAAAMHRHGCNGAILRLGDRDIVARCDVVLEMSDLEHPLQPLVEALAAGRPVVAAAVVGIPEIVRDGRCGILIPPGDVAASSAALRQLADAERRSAFATAALETARRHDIQLVGEAIMAVYREAIGGPAGEASNTWKRLTTTRLKPATQRLDSAAVQSSSAKP